MLYMQKQQNTVDLSTILSNECNHQNNATILILTTKTYQIIHMNTLNQIQYSAVYRLSHIVFYYSIILPK